MSRKFTIGGAGVVNYVKPADGYVVAMSGDFDGGVFSKVVGGPRDLGNGKSEYELEHYFVRKDGSSIYTRDVGVWHKVQGSDHFFIENTYNVVATTGAFEGLGGQFFSWGGVKLSLGQGILRFWGELSETSAAKK
jgi:hypothetical protein